MIILIEITHTYIVFKYLKIIILYYNIIYYGKGKNSKKKG